MRPLLLLFFILLFLPGAVFAIDTDGDGLSDADEAYYHTDPLEYDTDGDGFGDGIEVQYDYSPHMGNGARMGDHDYDGDGLNDWVERWFGTDIGFGDSDRDGYADFDEVMSGYDPADASPVQRFEKQIVVDRTNQQLFVEVDGIKVVSYPVSTGNPVTPTPGGEFEVQRKLDSHVYAGADYYYDDVKWNMQFFPRYYIHTAYWHDDFGERTRSHGCINMREADVEELYQYTDVGTTVSVIGETPKGLFVGT